MARSLSALMITAVLLIGCNKAKEVADAAAISKDLDKRGTTDLLKEAAEDSYDPPADGKLTEAQVQMYLKVREHEKKIAAVAKQELKQHAQKAEKAGEKSLAGMMEGFKAIGSAADFATADIRAAKDLKFNSQEYLWVKGQILAASSAAMAQQVNETMTASFDAAYAQAKKAYDEAKDEQTKKMYAEMLAGYEKSKQEMKTAQSEEDPAIAYNRQLLSKYENTLNALTQELSKYEDEKGSVEKAMQENEQQMEKAKADASKGQ